MYVWLGIPFSMDTLAILARRTSFIMDVSNLIILMIQNSWMVYIEKEIGLDVEKYPTKQR